MIEYLNYFKKPFYCESKKPDFRVFLGLFLFYFASAMVLGIFIVVLQQIFHLHERPLPWKSPLSRFLYIGITGPVTEEILFRSWLKVKNGISIALFLFLVSLYFFLYSKFTTAVIIFVICLGMASLLIIYGRKKIEVFIASHFSSLFYGSALIFGLLHATNFTGNPWIILAFSPFLGGPQIVMGFILGTIRMKNGLGYSILFHMIVNIISFIL